MQTTHSLRQSGAALLWQRVREAWRRRRAAAARRRENSGTLALLRGLDDATLRDLAIHRSEIGSVATEAGSRLQRRQRGADR